MYVAITRARRRLYLTLAQSRTLHGQMRYGIPSRFLDEIPRGLLQWLSGMPGRHDRYGEPHGRVDVQPAPARTAMGTEGSAYRIGQNVRHAKFGLGVIVNAEGRGADARVQVNFRDAGLKWLALEYARLEHA
jgi:DNA helicase-2/ATP-dependent DNA helicase PcrA